MMERLKYAHKNFTKKMNSTLIIFSTTDGQTKSICNRIASIIENNNLVNIININDVADINLSSFDQIIIGASIRYGKHHPDLYQFIKENKAVLDLKKSSFFSVNVVARKPEKNTAATNPYMQKFLKLADWEPNDLSVFAGKIDYPKYGFIDKHMIRFIMWMTKGPTDLSGTYEFTDWNKVDAFANQLVLLK